MTSSIYSLVPLEVDIIAALDKAKSLFLSHYDPQMVIPIFKIQKLINWI